MARSRKKIENQVDPENLTAENVWDILKFAQALGGGNFYNMITPLILNSRMKDITLNPIQPSESTLNAAMRNPKESELELQGFSQDFENQSQIYKKLLSYLGNLLSFDMTYYCTNAKSSDYKSRAYLKDFDAVKRFFGHFDYKHEFAIVVREMLRNEAFFCCPRDGAVLTLQELPSSPQYTMITGRNTDSTLSFSMNLYWFMIPGVDIRLYPPFFSEKFNNLWDNNKGIKGYNPSLPPELRGESSWVMWQDVPVPTGWCWKMSPEIATRIPYYTPLFLDLILQSQVRALQRSIYMSAAARILLGQIGSIKDPNAKMRDQFNISPALLGNFLGVVKAAIGEALQTAALPLDNVQAISFPSESIYEGYLHTTLQSSGVDANLIFSSPTKSGAIAEQLSLNNDEQQMYSLYPGFEQFLNYHVGRLTKNFKFKFKFEGSQFFNNRQQRLDAQMGLMGQGVILPNKLAAAIGMDPFEFQAQLEEAQGNEWVSKLTPIVPGFQQSATTKTNGRPQKSESDLTESGSVTRETGSNLEKGGNI